MECFFPSSIYARVDLLRTALQIFTPPSSIYARVGASDAQLKGISTFMAEMVEASTILHQADPRSLVLVDELGRGTSTQDGYGLAYAIAKYLINSVQCFTLFATHFHELGELEAELPGLVQNRHAEAQVAENGELAFLYNLKDGLAEKSYGVHVARVAQFPAEAIASAKRTADFLEDRAAKKVGRRSGRTSFWRVEEREKTIICSVTLCHMVDEILISQVKLGDGSAAIGSANSVSNDVDKILQAFTCSGAAEFARKLIKGEIARESFLGCLKGIDFGGPAAMEVDN